MNTKPQNNTQKDNSSNEQVVLPLLTAKEANRLANNVDRDKELQGIADVIRNRAEQGHLDIIIFVSNNNIGYIEKELTSKAYIVIYKGVNSLYISWR